MKRIRMLQDACLNRATSAVSESRGTCLSRFGAGRLAAGIDVPLLVFYLFLNFYSSACNQKAPSLTIALLSREERAGPGTRGGINKALLVSYVNIFCSFLRSYYKPFSENGFGHLAYFPVARTRK